MEEKKFSYLMKLAIDFGSTNTVMAWQIYEMSGGRLIRSERLNSANNIKSIPSIMIFKSENPCNEAVKQDVFGEDAEDVIRGSNVSPVVCDNFKQLIYTKEPGSPEFSKGVELITEFFRYLREVYRLEIYNVLPSEDARNMKVELSLSTPVRANPTHRTLMRSIAANAGFDAANGVTEIHADASYDEAECIMHYAFENKENDAKIIFEKAVSPEGALLMFIDVGGSTTDISIHRLTIENGKKTLNKISMWPDSDVRYPLGGCMIDEAVRDYLIENGFADREYTTNCWNHGSGKFQFRIFKEQNNSRLSDNGIIERLGSLAGVCYDYDEDIIPQNNYNKSPVKINSDIFTNVICKRYIEHMTEAFNEVFEKQRPDASKTPVRPEDIDAVFLTGGGSIEYFIDDVILGRIGNKKLNFEIIRRNEKMLFGKWDNPTCCCALGALATRENTFCMNYARDKYVMQLELYVADNELTDYLRKNPAVLCPDTTNYQPEGSEHSYSCTFIKREEFTVTEKFRVLPVRTDFDTEFVYTSKVCGKLCLKMAIYKVSENGTKELLGLPIVKLSGIRFSETAKTIQKSLIAGTVFLAADIAAELVDGAIGFFGGEKKLSKKLENAFAEFVLPTRDISIKISADAELGDNGIFNVSIGIECPYFKDLNQSFSANL